MGKKISKTVSAYCILISAKILLYVAGIQEGTECTKCKNDWALRAAIALLYVLCALLTIAVAILGYKGESRLTFNFACFGCKP